MKGSVRSWLSWLMRKSALRAEGRTLIADGLDEASRQLRAASELLLEYVDPDEMEFYLRVI